MAKKQSNRLPPFVPLLWEMLNSKAYRDLNYASAKALPFFLGKVKTVYKDPQRYSMDFSFSYSEGGRYGFASGTFSKIIKDLISHGFLDPVDKGGLRSDGKSYNRFRLSQRWECFETTAFEQIEWSCFLPKPRATSKKETDSFKKGNKRVSEDKVVSQFEAVGVF
jgi:hypothetical protein